LELVERTEVSDIDFRRVLAERHTGWQVERAGESAGGGDVEQVRRGKAVVTIDGNAIAQPVAYVQASLVGRQCYARNAAIARSSSSPSVGSLISVPKNVPLSE